MTKSVSDYSDNELVDTAMSVSYGAGLYTSQNGHTCDPLAEELKKEIKRRLANAGRSYCRISEPTYVGATVIDSNDHIWVRAYGDNDNCPWFNSTVSVGDILYHDGLWRDWHSIKSPRLETPSERAERGAPALKED